MQKPWSLYNNEEKLRVDDLTSEQVRIVLLATSNARMSHWYACQEGDVHWQPIGAIPEFYEDVRQIKGAPEGDHLTHTEAESAPASPVVKAAPERRPLFEEMPEEATSTQLQVENSRTVERRSARRFERRLGFKIAMGGENF